MIHLMEIDHQIRLREGLTRSSLSTCVYQLICERRLKRFPDFDARFGVTCEVEFVKHEVAIKFSSQNPFSGDKSIAGDQYTKCKENS